MNDRFTAKDDGLIRRDFAPFSINISFRGIHTEFQTSNSIIKYLERADTSKCDVLIVKTWDLEPNYMRLMDLYSENIYF